MHEVVRGDGVHVLGDMCATCVFRPGNLMHLRSGRLARMVREALACDGCIPCHSTIHGVATQPAICRGFFDRHKLDVWQLRLALATDAIVYDPPPPARGASPLAGDADPLLP